jgi:hypothetical protein
VITEDKARTRLKLMYGMTDIRQDPNGTWWIGSKLRPDLLNMDSLAAAVQYLDSLPEAMINSLSRPRGSDSEQHTQHSQQEPEHG